MSGLSLSPWTGLNFPAVVTTKTGRLITGSELVQLGVQLRVYGADYLIHLDVVRLWRSRRGYRKTCRALRRAGRRLGR